MDNQDDTEPRKFFCFDGCLVNLKGKELEIQVRLASSTECHPNNILLLLSCLQTAELMGGSVPRATYKFVADDEEKALEWYEAALKASSRRN